MCFEDTSKIVENHCSWVLHRCSKEKKKERKNEWDESTDCMVKSQWTSLQGGKSRALNIPKRNLECWAVMQMKETPFYRPRKKMLERMNKEIWILLLRMLFCVAKYRDTTQTHK